MTDGVINWVQQFNDGQTNVGWPSVVIDGLVDS